MNAISRSIRFATAGGLVVLAAVSLAPETAAAQQKCGDVAYLMLPWFRAADRAMATRARDAARDALDGELSSKEVCLVPQANINQLLRASGFPVDTVLTALESLQLARPLSATEFIQGEVRGTGNAVQMSGYIYLARDGKDGLREKIAAKPPSSLSQAAKSFAQTVKEIRKEFPIEKRCYAARSSGQFDVAESAARQAIVAYPEGILGRLCLAAALEGLKKSPDEIIAVAREILQRDSTNMRAVRIAMVQYDLKDDRVGFARMASEFIALDPTDSDVENVVNRLATLRLTDDALRSIATVLREDPENRNLQRLEFRLIYSTERYKDAAARGEILARDDSAGVDTLFIQRMVSAYSKDNQPDRVLAWLRNGTRKFPANVGFAIGLAQQLTTLGKKPEAIAVYAQLIRVSPDEPEIRLRIANAYNELGQTDSALVWLREAAKHGEEPRKVASVASTIANTFINAARDTKSVDDYEKAIPFIAFADSVFAGDGLAKFLWATTAYSIAGILTGTLEKDPSCPVAKEAKEWADLVSPKIMGGGGAFNATNAAAIMNALNGEGGFVTYLDGWIRARRCT